MRFTHFLGQYLIRTRYVVYYNKETGDTLKQEIMLQFMVCQREKSSLIY